MPITTRDGLLEAWATQIEAMEQNLEALYGPPGITPTLPALTTRDGMLEAIAEQAETAYVGIAKLYGAYHDNAYAYKLTMPPNLMDWYGVKKVGGRTIIYNQQNRMYRAGGNTATSYNVTFELDTDNMTCTANGKATGGTGAMSVSYSAVKDHVYLLTGCPSGGGSSTYYITCSAVSSTNKDEGSGMLFTETTTGTRYCIFRVATNYTADNLVFRANIFDLTQMFGAGNEPTTVEEAAAMFQAELYPYNNTGTLMNVGVKNIVVKDGATVKDTYTVPAEVQALAGYGMTCPNRTNYIDFEAKKFYQYVGSVDLSTLTWGYGPSVGWSATLNAKNPADDDTVFNGISATLTPVTRNVQATAFSGGTDAGMVSVSGGKVYVGTGDINIVPSGVLQYELATPVETDISAYLTDAPAPHVESGWDVIFEYDDDYRIPVPVQVDYIGV